MEASTGKHNGADTYKECMSYRASECSDHWVELLVEILADAEASRGVKYGSELWTG